MGTRPDQGSTDEMAARLKKAFNTSSLGLDNGGNTVQDSTQDLKKAQHTADLIEKTEVQAMLRDIGASEGISIALGSKNRKLEIKEKIEKQRWQRFLGHLLVQRSIEEAIERAREIIGFHQSQMDILAELIKEGREKLTELFEHKQALKQQIDHFRETGRFDLDENGRFRNSRAEEALAAWEEKTNSHIDLHSPSSYLSVLEAASDIEAQEAETKQGVERDEEDYRYHKTKRDEAIEIKDDLKSGDPVRCQQALERLENIEGRESITTARNLVSNKSEIHDQQKQEVSRRLELTDEDLSLDGFAFNFPPLQSDFTDAVQKAGNNLVAKEPDKIVPKPSLLNSTMK